MHWHAFSVHDNLFQHVSSSPCAFDVRLLLKLNRYRHFSSHVKTIRQMSEMSPENAQQRVESCLPSEFGELHASEYKLIINPYRD